MWQLRLPFLPRKGRGTETAASSPKVSLTNDRLRAWLKGRSRSDEEHHLEASLPRSKPHFHCWQALWPLTGALTSMLLKAASVFPSVKWSWYISQGGLRYAVVTKNSKMPIRKTQWFLSCPCGVPFTNWLGLCCILSSSHPHPGCDGGLDSLAEHTVFSSSRMRDTSLLSCFIG